MQLGGEVEMEVAAQSSGPPRADGVNPVGHQPQHVCC